MTSQHVYDNGVTRESQLAYNKTYRDRQKRIRHWVDQFAETMGVDREEVISVDPGDLAQAYKHFITDPRR